MHRIMLMRQTGFSLIELMVSVLLGLLLVMGTASFYSTLHITSLTASHLGAAQESLQAVNLVVGRAVRQAGNVSIPDSHHMTITYGTVVNGIPNIGCLGDASAVSDTFSLQGDQLLCNNVPIALGIENITFSLDGDTLVNVNVKPRYLPANYGTGIRLNFALWQKYIQLQANS